MSITEQDRPLVLIVGAGLGGLTLGALLENAGVPYFIFERSEAVSVIGSAIALGAGVMPMFKQLGIYDQLVAIARPSTTSRMYDSEGKLLLEFDFATGVEEKFSSTGLLFSRPALCNLLLDQIPKHKILYHKKLLSHIPSENGLTLHFSDNTSVEGSILVGADGANSGVRQNMYKELGKLGVLPASDKLPPKYSCISLVGQTRPLDPELYPLLQTTRWAGESVVSKDHTYISVAFPTAQNTLCWMVIQILDKESSKLHDSFRNSEWSPEAAEEMAKREEVRAARFPNLNKVSMGDLIDMTPKEMMSKMMLEEKVFKTWTHERVVLVGDACHKMTPAAGQGALNAMMDALVLANYIETLRGNNLEEIKSVCTAYKDERYARAKGAVDASAVTALRNEKGGVINAFRKFMNGCPIWRLWKSIMAEAGEYRPQVAFLPPVDDKGTCKLVYQPSLHLEKSTRRDTAV